MSASEYESGSEFYSNIRELLGGCILQTIVDIVQHDQSYFERTGRSYVELLLSSGDCLRFYTHSGVAFAVNVADDGETEYFGDC